MVVVKKLTKMAKNRLPISTGVLTHEQTKKINQMVELINDLRKRVEILERK